MARSSHLKHRLQTGHPLKITLGLLGLVACLSSTGCWPFNRAPGHRLIARVGSHAIYEDELYYRHLQQVAENPQYADQYAKSPTLIFRQMVQSLVSLEAMERHGMGVTRETLDREFDRMRHQSKFPGKLAEFHDIFPSEEMFLDIYVLPEYVARESYFDLFLGRPEFHGDALRVLESIKKAVSLREEASKLGLVYSRVRFERKKDGPVAHHPLDARGEPLPGPPPGSEAASLPAVAGFSDQELFTRLENYPVKQFTPRLDQLNSYSLIRVLKKEVRGGISWIEFESVSVHKADYSHWLNEEAARTRIECEQSDVCEAFKTEYAGKPVF